MPFTSSLSIACRLRSALPTDGRWRLIVDFRFFRRQFHERVWDRALHRPTHTAKVQISGTGRLSHTTCGPCRLGTTCRPCLSGLNRSGTAPDIDGTTVHCCKKTQNSASPRTPVGEHRRSKQKKLRQTGQLPPGWQRKLEPFPVVVERDLVVLPTGYQRGVIDGHAVIYNPRTQVIVDLALLS